MEGTLYISRVSELHLLRSNRKYQKVELHLPSLSNTGNRQWTHKLNKQYRTDGYETAKYFAITSLIIGFVIILGILLTNYTVPFSYFIYLAIIVIAMGFIGRQIGIVISNIKLDETISKIQSQAHNQRLSSKG
ncbi:MAG: hypothetical protein HRT68_06070 [Flavobacteriaceae bacterium]|nr:hypothetical protein [Flavobacteriaceae bacterium]